MASKAYIWIYKRPLLSMLKTTKKPLFKGFFTILKFRLDYGIDLSIIIGRGRQKKPKVNKMKKQKNIARFIESEIEDMKGNIPYAMENEMEMDKGEWVRWSNEYTYNMAYGALLYAHVYTKEINDEEYEVLSEKLRNAFITENRKSFGLK